MTLPIQGNPSLMLAVVFGAIFGALLHRGKVADYNTIVNQFRLHDFTVMRVMLTAILVGGVGVYFLHGAGYAQYHIKSADMLAVVLGAALFGVGMVVYGYCPGTGIAAIGTGSIHALAGAAGMLIGGVIFGFSYPWLLKAIVPVASYGKIRLPEVTGIGDMYWFGGIALLAFFLFRFISRREAALR